MSGRTWVSPVFVGGLVATSVAALAACVAEYSHVEIRLDRDQVSLPGLNVASDRVQMPAHASIDIHAYLHSASVEPYPSAGSLALRSRDSQLLEVNSRADDWGYELYGHAPGETCIEVVVDGRPEDCVDVVIGPRYVNYLGVDLTKISSTALPFAVQVSSRGISVPEALVVGVQVRVRTKKTGPVEVQLQSTDASLLRVEALAGDDRFALVAVAQGQTCIEVIVDGHVEECIPARVLAPI